MIFALIERKELTTIKRIRHTFVTRLEQMESGSVKKLVQSSWKYIVEMGSEITGSTCYKNSPQARKAIKEAIYWAKEKFGQTEFFV